MRDLFGWFRRYVLRRVTVTASTAHWLCAGDGFKISQSQSGTYDGAHIVTRILDANSFEARRYRRGMSVTHRYLCAMFLSFGSGMFQVALVDLRPDSPAFGRRNTFYVGALRPWQILIPPGVGHGYKVISQEPGMLVYVTDRVYNPADEGRIPYNDPGINYDWELQHK